MTKQGFVRSINVLKLNPVQSVLINMYILCTGKQINPEYEHNEQKFNVKHFQIKNHNFNEFAI